MGVHRVGPLLLNFDNGVGRILDIGKPEPAATVALADLFEGSDSLRIDIVHQSVGAPRGSISLGSQRRQTSQARKTVGFRSDEHTSELQSLMRISYAVFCLKKKKTDR